MSFVLTRVKVILNLTGDPSPTKSTKDKKTSCHDDIKKMLLERLFEHYIETE